MKQTIELIKIRENIKHYSMVSEFRQMTSREERRARIDELFKVYEEEIDGLTATNVNHAVF